MALSTSKRMLKVIRFLMSSILTKNISQLSKIKLTIIISFFLFFLHHITIPSLLVHQQRNQWQYLYQKKNLSGGQKLKKLKRQKLTLESPALHIHDARDVLHIERLAASVALSDVDHQLGGLLGQPWEVSQDVFRGQFYVLRREESFLGK